MKTRVLLALGVLLLAGCGVGQDAQTALTAPSIAGVSADVGDLAVRNAVVEFASAGYPAGGEAPVRFAVANNGQTPVRLVGFESEGATSVTLQSVVSLDATTPPDGGATEVALAPGQLATVTLLLTGLTEALDGTNSVPLTLSFDNGAVVPLGVPMANTELPLPRETPLVEGEEGVEGEAG